MRKVRVSPLKDKCRRSPPPPPRPTHSNFYSLMYFISFSSAITKVQVSALKDKCRTVPNATKKHTDTMSLLIDALKPVENSIALLASSRGNDMQKLLDNFEFYRAISLPFFSLIVALRTAIDWFQTKSQYFVSSASWEQFLVITTEDTAALQERLRCIVPHVISLSKRIHLLEKPNLILEHAIESVLQMIGEVKVSLFFSDLLHLIYGCLICRVAPCLAEPYVKEVSHELRRAVPLKCSENVAGTPWRITTCETIRVIQKPH